MGFKQRNKATVRHPRKQVFLKSLHLALKKCVSDQTCCGVFFRVFVTEVVVGRNAGGRGVDCLLSSGGPSLVRLIVITVNRIWMRFSRKKRWNFGGQEISVTPA